MVFLGTLCWVLMWSQTTYGQVKLEYKYTAGQRLTYKTTSKQYQTLTLMGMEIESSDERTTVTSFATGKRRSDSTLPLEQKVESLRVNLGLPGGIRVDFDTTNINAKITDPAVAFIGDMLKVEAGLVYIVVLDEHNKVKAVEGAEKLQEKIASLDAQTRDLLSRRFDSERLKRSFEQETQILPDVLARPGESWKRNQIIEIGGGQTLSFRKKFEYKGTEKAGGRDLDKIATRVLEVKYNSEPDSNLALKPIKSNLKAESSNGLILFDREAGHVVSSKDKIRIKGDMTFSANGQEVPSTLDLNIETSVDLQPGN